MTIIELTDDEANLFILFRKYQDQFAYLISEGFFETKGGHVIVHFNANSTIMYGEVSSKWQRRKKKTGKALTGRSKDI